MNYIIISIIKQIDNCNAIVNSGAFSFWL